MQGWFLISYMQWWLIWIYKKKLSVNPQKNVMLYALCTSKVQMMTKFVKSQTLKNLLSLKLIQICLFISK